MITLTKLKFNLNFPFPLITGCIFLTSLNAQIGEDSIERSIRNYPAISFDQINKSIDQSLNSYGERIRRIQNRMNQNDFPQYSDNLDTEYPRQLRVPLRNTSAIETYNSLDKGERGNYRKQPEQPNSYAPLHQSPTRQSYLPADIERNSDALYLSQTNNSLAKPPSPLPVTSRAKMGIYLLPFVGMQIPETFDWNVGLQQKLGMGGGFRIGQKWEYFFIEADFWHFRNKFDGFDGEVLLAPNNPFESGSVTGLGGFLNLGANIPMGEKYGFGIGAGLGYGIQKIKLDLFNEPQISEEDELLSYQLLAEFYHEVTKSFRWGLRYRWIQIDEMELFSERTLHSFEISGGFLF